MCPNARTAMGPELALVELRTSVPAPNAALLAALRDEYGGAAVGWVLRPDRARSGGRLLKPRNGPSLWDRLFGKDRPSDGASGTRTAAERSDRSQLVRKGPARAAEGFR